MRRWRVLGTAGLALLLTAVSTCSDPGQSAHVREQGSG